MSDIVNHVMGFDSGGAVTSPADLLARATAYAKSTAYDAPISAYEDAQLRAQGAFDNVGQGPGEGTDPATRQLLESQLYDTGPDGTISASSAASQAAKPLFDQAYDALKADPKAVAALPPQQALQYNFLAKQHGDLSQADFTAANQKIMQDAKIPEYSGAGANRMQFNLLGNEPGRPGLLAQDPYRQIADIGSYTIPSDPSDSWNMLQEIANNPIANIVATMIPGGSAVLAGIRIGQHGDVTPGDVIGMLNGGAQLYSYNAASTAALEAGKSAAQAQAAGIKGTVGIAELATDAGKDVFTSMFPDASKAVGDFTQSIKDLGASAVSSVKDVLGVSNPMSTEASANLVAQIPRFPSPTDAISAPDTSYRDYLAGLQPSGVEQIIVPGSRSIVDTVLNAAAGVPAAVSSAPDATGPNTSPGTVTYGTETPTWKPSNSAILNFLASNPSQAAIDAAKAQYHVSDEDIAKAKETEVRTVTGSNTGVGASDILAALPTAVTPTGGTGVTPTTPPPMDVLTTYGSTAGPVTNTQLPGVDAVIPALTQTTVDTTKAPPTGNTKIDLPSGGAPPPVTTPQAPASLAMPKPTEIDPYTWESIFRNKEQAKKYISPFDRGDEVAYDDTSQMLRDMLRS